MANKVTFHGQEKEIRIISWVTNIDVKVDLYSDWKEWAIQGTNLKWNPAFKVVWGDPTSAGQTAPTYYFLSNWWRLIADDVTVDISLNLYTDTGESPVIQRNGASVNLVNSDIPGVSSSSWSWWTVTLPDNIATTDNQKYLELLCIAILKKWNYADIVFDQIDRDDIEIIANNDSVDYTINEDSDSISLVINDFEDELDNSDSEIILEANS